ncbi:hypothetical protein GN316_03085 [Xylophilus sp. Kf1]|nr:hypothetical protein [Xylophilus sp. Kf1]
MKRRKSQASTGTASAAKKADIMIAIGATGSGKSTRVNGDIQRRGLQRLMLWDPQHEYEGPAVSTIDALATAVQAETFRVRFLPSWDTKVRIRQFDLFCRIAYEAGRCALVCEELSQVVNANGGGPGWTQVLTAGRHRELIVYGTSQRPALVDKTALSQATRLYCGNLEFPPDVKVMSVMLGVGEGDIQALGPLDYIERHRETKALHRGNLKTGAPP